MARRWQCLEIECGVWVTAESDDALIDPVNAHMREAHASYELEEVILASSEDAPDEQDT